MNYKNSSLTPQERTEDLLSRMNLEEKIAQMMCIWNEKYDKFLDQDGSFNQVKAKKYSKTVQELDR